MHYVVLSLVGVKVALMVGALCFVVTGWVKVALMAGALCCIVIGWG